MPQISFKSFMNNSAPIYSALIAQPFRDELTGVNFKELLTPAEVDAALNRQDDKTILAVLNSVGGCAAHSARPAVILSMIHAVVPDEYVTLFAGMEKEAVEHFRKNYLQAPVPSSPNIAVFKNRHLLHYLQRHHIKGKTAGDIAKELTGVFDKVCTKRNSPEEIDKLKSYIANKYQVSIESLNS